MSEYNKEDIKNLHYNNVNEIQYEYGGQIYHCSMEHLKEILVTCWNLQQENKQLKADLEMYENGVYFSSENDKLQNEIDNLNHIIDKQDKDITILSKGNKHLKEVIDKIGNIISLIDELRKDTGGYPSDYIDKLLDILKEVE